jgi:hypothetical protein
LRLSACHSVRFHRVCETYRDVVKPREFAERHPEGTWSVSSCLVHCKCGEVGYSEWVAVFAVVVEPLGIAGYLRSFFPTSVQRRTFSVPW